MAPHKTMQTRGIGTLLIAPCGMNCYLCRAYRPDKEYIKTCPGCRGENHSKPRSCVACRIKNCEKMQTGGFKFCFQCDGYPCARLKRLDKRYRVKYGMSMIENLGNIKKYGVRQFITSQKERWACAQCGTILCVHKPQCFACGSQWR